MKIIRLLLITIFSFTLLNCQNTNSKIDEIVFTYESARRIPYSSVRVEISKTHDKKSAVAFIHCEPASEEAKWKYSKIDTVRDIDIESFEKLIKETDKLENIDLDKAYSQGMDGSTWKIEFGSRGKNLSYSFWVPLWKTKERGLLDFVKLSEDILDQVKLNRKEILND